jgi:Zn-dependent protease with chaperone function
VLLVPLALVWALLPSSIYSFILEFYFSLFELVLLVPLALLWALLPNDGVAVVANWFIDKVVTVMIELPFSRDMETEADQVGMLMAAKVSTFHLVN